MEQILYERPREKLRSKGVSYLTLIELAQIIIGSGSAKVSAARLSRQIVKLVESDDVSYDELVAINGLGDAKTCQILAAIEFGMRINTNAIREKHSTSANNHLSTSLIKLARSHPNNILAAWLNGAGNVCGSKFYKNLNTSSTVLAQQVISDAVAAAARSIILIIHTKQAETSPNTRELSFLIELKNMARVLHVNILDVIAVDSKNQRSWKKLPS